MGGPPKSILAISDLTLGGSTDRADVPIGNAQQSLLQQRDRWFESGSLQRRVRLSRGRGLCRSRTPGFARVSAAAVAARSAETRKVFDIATTDGNISVGRYSSTAVLLRLPTALAAKVPSGVWLGSG